MEEIIRVENLYKVYKIYKRPLDRLRSLLMKDTPSELYTALDDISFTVKEGETIGIIGENGAGKSTLLKILSGVLTPTRGSVDVNALALSILELGVGFHPEFTGRENIFFYGDVLGFGRDFLNAKVDEIIEFSELGSFIDRPIKTYSSGMLMRLAFSIVSSFNPDILILDEVLAVGDIHFQRKSLNRILEFRKKGKTILFCSHDVYHVRMLCDRVIWLKQGRVHEMGEAEGVIFKYEKDQLGKENMSVQSPSSAPVVINDVRLLNEGTIKTFDDIKLRIITAANENVPYHVYLSIKISNEIGICGVGTHLSQMKPCTGNRIIKITFPRSHIIKGIFYAHARVFDETGLILYHEKLSPFFEVIKNGNQLGFCYLECDWEIE